MLGDDQLWYDREGKSISGEEFDRLRSLPRYKIIAQTALRGRYISTVWIGLDCRMITIEDGEPLIFETMIFRETPTGVDYGPDLFCARYSTESAARIGHALAVNLVESGSAIVFSEEREQEAER